MGVNVARRRFDSSRAPSPRQERSGKNRCASLQLSVAEGVQGEVVFLHCHFQEATAVFAIARCGNAIGLQSRTE
jgi:hypothetical protein